MGKGFVRLVIRTVTLCIPLVVVTARPRIGNIQCDEAERIGIPARSSVFWPCTSKNVKSYVSGFVSDRLLGKRTSEYSMYVSLSP